MAEAALSMTGGVLLAGGRSSRFGAEKAVARVGGRLMMDAVCECFAPLSRIAASVRRGSAAEHHARELQLDVLYDDPALPAGPLAGVAAGLTWARQHQLHYLATAPCDTPLLPRQLFAVLLDGIGEASAAFATTAHGPNPLCAVWRTALLPRLLTQLSGEHPSVRGFLTGIGAKAVRFAEAPAFANVNTPEALAALERGA
jgi:molybdopterin-guanine dinucleotide biosynthesis protein A